MQEKIFGVLVILNPKEVSSCISQTYDLKPAV